MCAPSIAVAEILALCLAFLCGAACPPCAAAQEPTIRVSTNLVLVPVSVTHPMGKSIIDLGIDDFEVEENGKRVALVRLGEAGKTPLELALIFDISGSVHARFELEREAASSFLKAVFRPDDAVSIFSVGAEPRVLLRRTSSLEDALAALASVAPTAQATALFDSVVAAAHALRSIGRPDTRRVLVALSDGEDNRSTGYALAGVLQEIQKSDCLFYSINPSGRSLRMNTVSQRGQEALEAMARHTGGASYVADRLEDLSDFYGRVAAVLKSQYLLEYYSPDTGLDGGYRRIAVRVPSQPYLQVRARQGYYATGPSR